MDKRFLRLYNEELQFVRESSAEFAAEYPKIASRLHLDPSGKEVCEDPFVERLLEGFAFLTARVRHKFEAEFPRFTQGLLETVYPHYLSPVPSMLIARFEPDLTDGALLGGFPVPRGTSLRALRGKGERTACEYRTAHALTLWPVRVAAAEYLSRGLGVLNLPPGNPARAAFRIRLELTAGATGAALARLPHLDFHLHGADETPVRVAEQLFARRSAALLRPVDPGGRLLPPVRLPEPALRRVGFAEDEALLPRSPRTFEGYRLLSEYFACPQRFLFFRVEGLGAALAGSEARAFDLILLLDAPEPQLDGRVDAGTFELFCTPAVNLFPKRADRIPLSGRTHEYPVIADRTRPLDFEIYRIEKVTGVGVKTDEEQEFRPFYLARHGDGAGAGGAFYATHRLPRTLTQKERRFGASTAYTGSELHVSLVDARAVPYASDLRQLAVETLVTNRHLPLAMGTGLPRGDFEAATGPVTAIRCLSGPTPPRPSFIDGDILWRVISHLSLNYFSLVGGGGDAAAAERGGGGGSEAPAALREILRLYARTGDAALAKQIDGVRAVASRPVVRRVEAGGPLAFARGAEMRVTFDEAAFEGSGIFLLGAVLERFFAKYASLNSFTETVIVSEQRGEILRWPIQMGLRPVL